METALSTDWRGSAARQDDFRPDATLSAGWYQAQSTSYTGSGFDRGHLCPSADRTNTVPDNSATFLMTNMMPQAPRNNQQTWANLEDYCRTSLNSDNEVYIIAGSYGRGGTGTNSYMTTLDQSRVTVPARCWKVVVIIPAGTDDTIRVTTSTRVIAIDTPNDNSISTTWGTYRTSVDAIEAATGYDILSAVYFQCLSLGNDCCTFSRCTQFDARSLFLCQRSLRILTNLDEVLCGDGGKHRHDDVAKGSKGV